MSNEIQNEQALLNAAAAEISVLGWETKEEGCNWNRRLSKGRHSIRVSKSGGKFEFKCFVDCKCKYRHSNLLAKVGGVNLQSLIKRIEKEIVNDNNAAVIALDNSCNKGLEVELKEALCKATSRELKTVPYISGSGFYTYHKASGHSIEITTTVPPQYAQEVLDLIAKLQAKHLGN